MLKKIDIFGIGSFYIRKIFVKLTFYILNENYIFDQKYNFLAQYGQKGQRVTIRVNKIDILGISTHFYMK